MIRIGMNEQWFFRKCGESRIASVVDLPHDAMLAEPRSETSSGGANISWFPGGDYEYEKVFRWPEVIGDRPPPGKVLVEFEGVYRNAQVFLDGKLLTERPYGYTNFYADLTDHLTPGEHALRVIARNSHQPNSRWYTGSGIYRPVHLCLFPPRHILEDSIRITSLSIAPPTIGIRLMTNAPGRVTVDILPDRGDEVLWQTSADVLSPAEPVQCQLSLPGAKLWSPETPTLYRCRVRFQEDEQTETFGVRVVECDAGQGLRINGQRVILRGACVHHDNGVLGAVANPFAIERKVRLLKELGYNALRSAHNPCSKVMLEICDRMGMLMMDEYVDMWYIHKTKYDYASDFDKWWRADLSDMVRKDYNHPCVILYSIGNEVAETGQRRGIALTGEMRGHIRAMDTTRPITCGVNIFFNYLFSLGFGVYSDKKAAKTEITGPKRHRPVGSEFFNVVAGIMGAGFMKFGATLHGSNVRTRDAYAALDVAGYNYGINRYKRDLKQYPDRVILGSETFCADTWRFWEMAKANPAIIGDFVWAGMDYLGEAGIGAWEYEDYAPDFSHGAGWLTAGQGRLDVTGYAAGEAAYTRVAYELEDIGMAVVPVSREKRTHSPSAWKLTNALPSWSWHGMEGARAQVEVYARAHRVALFLNGKKAGAKTIKRDCRFVFRIPYQPGVLEAVAYDENNAEIARTALKTAQPETCLLLEPELDALALTDLAYIRMRYGDKSGELHPLARGLIDVQVENGTLLGLGNGCAYNEHGYLRSYTDTYYGVALAVVKPNGEGPVILRAQSPYGSASVFIPLQ